MMKFTTRELVLLAVFGALWGVVEITLGSVLKSLNVPLSGVVLAGIGLMIALIARLFVPGKGSTLFVGIIAMLLKLFSLGGVIIGPMMSIFAEALIAELVLSGLGVSSASFILAGALGVSWSLVQPFITGPLLLGRTLLEVWVGMVERAARTLGLNPQAVVLVIMAFIAVHLLVGGGAGWLSWKLGGRLQRRVQVEA